MMAGRGGWSQGVGAGREMHTRAVLRRRLSPCRRRSPAFRHRWGVGLTRVELPAKFAGHPAPAPRTCRECAVVGAQTFDTAEAQPRTEPLQPVAAEPGEDGITAGVVAGEDAAAGGVRGDLLVQELGERVQSASLKAWYARRTIVAFSCMVPSSVRFAWAAGVQRESRRGGLRRSRGA